MYTFKYVKDPENTFDTTDVTIEADITSLYELLEVFHKFVLANGFTPKGTLEYVEEPENDNV